MSYQGGRRFINEAGLLMVINGIGRMSTRIIINQTNKH